MTHKKLPVVAPSMLSSTTAGKASSLLCSGTKCGGYEARLSTGVITPVASPPTSLLPARS